MIHDFGISHELELWRGLAAADRPVSTTVRPTTGAPERRYRERISEHLVRVIGGDRSSGVAKQYLASDEELAEQGGMPDPLGEARTSPVRGLVRRYGNRAALHLTNACAAFCRFCLRKHKIGGRDYVISRERLIECLHYLAEHQEIRDLVLTGGDPLALDDRSVEVVLSAIKQIPSIQIVRIDTRVPVQAPDRITAELGRVLRGTKPLFVIVHVNHPSELTVEARRAIEILADSRAILLSHSVLLQGVNDDVKMLETLFMELVAAGVKPYHLYQANDVRGTTHFVVPLDRAIGLVNQLWGRVSGIGMPTFVLNLENGIGKIPLGPGMKRTEFPPGRVALEDHAGNLIDILTLATVMQEEGAELRLTEGVRSGES